MRIALQIALGVSNVVHLAHGSFSPYGCGPCIAMMPCPCPMASMAAPMVMQAPQTYMQAPPMVMQVASQANVRPCNTQSVAVSSAESSSSNSVSGPTFNTGDISSIIKEILKAELTGHWTNLMDAISNFNSQTDSRSVTNNFYTQNNRAGFSHDWFAFIQALIDRLERQPNRTPQDERNLRILDRLRDTPPTQESETQTFIISDPAPRAPEPALVIPPKPPVNNAPLSIIPPLAIGWETRPTDLIPAYGTDVARSFDPNYNPWVDYLRLVFGQLCEDSLCRSGASTLARMIVFLNMMTGQTGTSGLPDRFALRDWISVSGPARDAIYVQLLRDSLNKFHHTFCLGEARARCNELKPTLVNYLTRMLSVETELADEIRSTVIILLANGSIALDWKRLTNISKQTESAPPAEPAMGPKVPVPILLKDKEAIVEAEQKIRDILDKQSNATIPMGGDNNGGGGGAVVQKKVEDIVRNSVPRETLTPEERAFKERFSQMTEKEQIAEIMRILDVTVKRMMGIADKPGPSGAAAGAQVTRANEALIKQAEMDAEARRVAEQMQMTLNDVGVAGSSGNDKVDASITGPTDLVVAAPEAKSSWTKIYGIADRLEDDVIGGDRDGQQQDDGRLVMYKQPRFVFAHHLSDFLKKGVKYVLPMNMAPVAENRMIVGGSDRVVPSSEKPAEGLMEFDKMELSADGEAFAKLIESTLVEFCKQKHMIRNAEDCTDGAAALASLLAYVDEHTGHNGVSTLDVSDGTNVFTSLVGNKRFNRAIDEALGRVWNKFCKTGGRIIQCQGIVDNAAKFLLLVSQDRLSSGYRQFISTVLWKGYLGMIQVVSGGKSAPGTKTGVPVSTALAIENGKPTTGAVVVRNGGSSSVQEAVSLPDIQKLFEPGFLERKFGLTPAKLRRASSAVYESMEQARRGSRLLRNKSSTDEEDTFTLNS